MTVVYDTRLHGCVVCDQPLKPFDHPVVKGRTLHYEACTRCGLVHMNPRPSAESLDTYYEESYRLAHGDEEGEQTTDAQLRRAYQQRQFVGSRPRRHLDIGCSMGTLLEAIGAEVRVGVEPGDSHRTRAADLGIETYETVDQLLTTDPEPFDLITLSHVVEHLSDPVASLAALQPLLAPGGRLMVEVPYLYRSIAYEIDHILVFTMGTLVSTLRAAGFEPVEQTMHKARQGGLGYGHNLAVLAVPGEAVQPVDAHVDVRLMKVRRTAGFAPQQFYRWRHRQQRRVKRNVRKVLSH